MLKLILPLLAASALSAQVSMPVSPVLGSPTLLIVNWDSAQTTGPLVLIMHSNPGQVQGSCYLSLTRDGAAVTGALYRTTTSTPEEPVGGLVGGAPWYYPTISSNACTVYLNDSVVNGDEVRLRIENGVTPYNKQVVANYTTPCPPGAPWWQCGWGANFVSTTIGSWDATPALPDTTPPTISAVDPVPAATSASVAWATNEISDTQVYFGPTVGYGSSSAMNSNLVLAHSSTLTGLTPGTRYNFQVRSRDGAGNLATTSGSFSTARESMQASAAPAAATGPCAAGAVVLSIDYKVERTGNNTVRLYAESWLTNPPNQFETGTYLPLGSPHS